MDMKVVMLLSFPERRGIVQNRDKSTKITFEAAASEFAAAMHLSAFPDFAVIEATFVLKEVAGTPVATRKKKGA